MKIKRQVFCGCGSKKHYSSCCSSKKIVIFDPPWQKIRETAKTIIYQHLVPYVETLDPDLMHEAWLEFWVDEKEWPEGILRDCFETVFIPWFLFQRNSSGAGTIAYQYLTENKNHLNEYEQCFIQVACEAQYSFYIVLDKVPGLHIEVQNLLLQSYHIIKEPHLSEAVDQGNILFMLLLEVKGHTIFLGMSPYSIPSNYYQLFLELRKHLQKQGKITPQLLKRLSIEVKKEFLRILKTLLSALLRQEMNLESQIKS